jgi:translation initiation factor 1 (eIF-1/SUI1)
VKKLPLAASGGWVKKLWVAIQGEQSKIRQLLARLDKRKMPYGIAELAVLDPKMIIFST